MAHDKHPARSAHWDSFWREADDDAQIMGSAEKRATLTVLWSAFLRRESFSKSDIVLDIASGAAPIARTAMNSENGSFAPVFVGVDYSPSALYSARDMCGGVMLASAADAAALPFAGGSFRAVVSQFGIEYAGLTAFGEAARVLAPECPFLSISHYKGGAIDAECAENARLLDAALSAGLFEAARSTFSFTFKARGAGASQLLDEALEKVFVEVGSSVQRTVENADSSAAKSLLQRFLADLATLGRRRLAYAEGDALHWLDAFQGRLEDYRARMRAMVASAIDEAQVRDVETVLSGAACRDFAAEPVVFVTGEKPAAWRLEARRCRN